MGRIVVTEFVSIDGVMPGTRPAKTSSTRGGPSNSIAGEDGNQFKLDETLEADALLHRADHVRELRRRLAVRGRARSPRNSTACPSTSSPSPPREPGVEQHDRARGCDAVDRRRRSRRQITVIIQVPGSLKLVQALFESDLVDELHLMVFPVVLGTGRRLFGETSESRLGGSPRRSRSARTACSSRSMNGPGERDQLLRQSLAEVQSALMAGAHPDARR